MIGVLLLALLSGSQSETEAGSYDLSITTEAGLEKRATLTCRPTGGMHPEARAACRQLVKARGDIAAIPPADGVCTTEYAPVTLRAFGLWNGTEKEFEGIFSNQCVANRQTGGHVFNF
ncbi:SSI family serine proteinase inhibitor [Allorhizocola rhizosphaerae]|uniref:SSI family serine proteinase inhibitor n=1 Tax=Allorhizocola rhizosphaerae TaxID=1872709 RepID=UPI000E3E14B8|nr:SSI family serine proteinase inhibitor [Allorhizocola rhizosphaerae]